VSEASVYRILKAYDLITSPAYVVLSAADEFRDNLSQLVDHSQGAIPADVPRRSGDSIFLNRKPPDRYLVNNEEIREDLIAAGYVEVFMEDFGAAEQIAIILRASRIVGKRCLSSTGLSA
jgi:capsular polysaccharide biosynthesis protein